jgi:hypothetical protein
MKTILKISGLSALLIMLLSIVLPDETKQNNNTSQEGYLIGSYVFLEVPNYHTGNYYNWYKNNYKFNSLIGYGIHSDSDKCTYDGKNISGGFYDTIISYDDNILDIIDNYYTSGMEEGGLLLEREKIIRPCYGQSSIYEAEDLENISGTSPKYYYEESETGMEITDTVSGNPRVKYCKSGRDTAGYIVKDLIENMEQINNGYREESNYHGKSYYFSDRKTKSYRWYIKPRMRIDSIYAKTYPFDTVITLITNDFLGNTIDSTHILCRNFLQLKNNEYYYDGRYLERYFNFCNDELSLSFIGDTLFPGTVRNEKGVTLNLSESKVDYRIYWHGKVDVWLDYVKLEDEWAHFLFYDFLDALSATANRWKFHNKIKSAAETFCKEDKPVYFYLDEWTYNNLPCIKEVNKIIKTYNPDTKIIPILSDNRFTTASISGLRYPPKFNESYFEDYELQIMFVKNQLTETETNQFPH